MACVIRGGEVMDPGQALRGGLAPDTAICRGKVLGEA